MEHVFLIHWNGKGPIKSQVDRFTSPLEADAYSYECLPGDRVAHIITGPESFDRSLFKMGTLELLYAGVTGNNFAEGVFSSLQNARERIYRELVSRFAPKPVPDFTPPPRSANQQEPTMPAAFVILASLEKPSIRSFADLESATAARKGEAIVVETAEALNPLSMAQLVALYNKTKPEVLVASKFANKGAGVTKLWDRMQSIPYSTAPAERKARTPKEPKAPKAPSEPRTVGKAPAAEGKAIRAGTVTAAILARMLLGTDTLEQIAANANVPACAAGAKTE